MSQHDNKVPMSDGSGFTTKRIVLSAVISTVTLLAILAGTWGFQLGVDKIDKAMQEPASPLMGQPRVSRGAPLDLPDNNTFRAQMAEDRRHLNSYGWVAEDSGIAHIPIERAKALYLERHK